MKSLVSRHIIRRSSKECGQTVDYVRLYAIYRDRLGNHYSYLRPANVETNEYARDMRGMLRRIFERSNGGGKRCNKVARDKAVRLSLPVIWQQSAISPGTISPAFNYAR